MNDGIVHRLRTTFVSHSMSIQNITPLDCQIAYRASTLPLMQTIRFVHIFCCVIGLIVSTLFTFVLLTRSSRNLHVNLRLSLISMTYAAWIACFQLLFSASYSLFTFLTNPDPCSALHDAAWCAVIRYPIVLSIYSTLCGIIVIAIERTIATVKYKTYEVHGSRCVAVTLISAQWIICIVAGILTTYSRTEKGYIHYCTAYVSHPKSAVFSLSLMSLMEVFTLLFCVLLQRRNEHRQVKEFVNNAMHTLTERYQLQENVKIMRIIIPSVTVHTILGLIGALSMLVFTIVNSNEDRAMLAQFAPFSEIVLLVVPLHAVVFPLVAIGKNKQLRLATRRSLPYLFNTNKKRQQYEKDSVSLMQDGRPLTSRSSAQVEKEGDVHFNMLNDMWKR